MTPWYAATSINPCCNFRERSARPQQARESLKLRVAFMAFYGDLMAIHVVFCGDFLVLMVVNLDFVGFHGFSGNCNWDFEGT
jgi:hypothetical protein